MSKPTFVLVTTVTGSEYKIDTDGIDANRFAEAICKNGFRHWNQDTMVATFFPPHRVSLVEVAFGK